LLPGDRDSKALDEGTDASSGCVADFGWAAAVPITATSIRTPRAAANDRVLGRSVWSFTLHIVRSPLAK
jgi:hypothetical protein